LKHFDDGIPQKWQQDELAEDSNGDGLEIAQLLAHVSNVHCARPLCRYLNRNACIEAKKKRACEGLVLARHQTHNACNSHSHDEQKEKDVGDDQSDDGPCILIHDLI
jgi:hypothetical protein